jgi:type IV fimbrial biogenesis protein FimT
MQTKRRNGFTLVELAVVVGTLCILVSIAVPGFINWLPDYRLKSASRDIVSYFQLAKLTAVKKNTTCSITFNESVDGESYDYVVFMDSDNDLRYDAGEAVVKKVLFSERYNGVGFDTSQGGGDGLTFSNNGNGDPSIAFRSNGLTRDQAGNLTSGTAFLINSKNKASSVVVSSAGNIRIN